MQKNQKNLIMRSMRTFGTDKQTSWRSGQLSIYPDLCVMLMSSQTGHRPTDGADYIGPAVRPKGRVKMHKPSLCIQCVVIVFLQSSQGTNSFYILCMKNWNIDHLWSSGICQWKHKMYNKGRFQGIFIHFSQLLECLLCRKTNITE